MYIDEASQISITNINEYADNRNKQKFNVLNEELNENEVTESIKNVKNKKSPGDDQINNEMLKSTNKEVILLLTKLFNTILKVGYFPKA